MSRLLSNSVVFSRLKEIGNQGGRDMDSVSGEQTAINETLQAWGRAMGERRAADAVAQLTDNVIQFTLAAPLSFEGKSAEGLAAWFETWQGPIGGEVRDGRLTAGDDVAFW